MMRSVSFVDRLELEFTGNHFSHAVTLGDVDTDGLNELVIGNVDGVLAIFKGKSNKPLKKCSDLGTITCVGVGNLFNTGKNVLVSINTEGMCHLFDITTPSTPAPSRPSSTSSVSSDSPEQHRSKNAKSMRPMHTQTIPTTNVKTMCIAPVGPQGQYDLVVGHTDRCIAVYHWNEENKSLELVKKFSLSGQIGSVSLSVKREGTPQLLISQPGGTYVPLRNKNDLEVASSDSPHPKAKNSDKQSVLMQCDVVGQPQRRNPTSSTEIVGHIIDNVQCPTDTTTQHSDIVALCTLDGTIRMLKDEVKQWELQVDHSLFAIERLDVTGNGSDEIVACAWDGMTYIVDLKRNIVRYKFEQNVSAFTAGYYGYGDRNEPCLIYTTFSNRIYIYHNITLPAVPSSNLFLALQNTETPKDLHKKLETLDDNSKRKLFQECLYQCSHNTQTEEMQDS